MKITLRDGKIKYYTGVQNINPSGGLLFLTGTEGLAIKNIVAIRLTMNVPVEIALAADNPPGVPGIAWMGNGWPETFSNFTPTSMSLQKIFAFLFFIDYIAV